MEKRKNVTRAFRVLSIVFGLTVVSLTASSIKLFASGYRIEAIFVILLAQLAAKYAEWLSFDGLRM